MGHFQRSHSGLIQSDALVSSELILLNSYIRLMTSIEPGALTTLRTLRVHSESAHLRLHVGAE
jgi:hypothetical protein